MNNIAEGFEKHSDADFANYLNISISQKAPMANSAV
jgi:four helix bundle protein